MNVLSFILNYKLGFIFAITARFTSDGDDVPSAFVAVS